LLAAVAATALVGAALDPVGLAVLAATAGALAWPMPLGRGMVGSERVASSFGPSPRFGGAGPAAVVPALVLAAAWSPLLFIDGRAPAGAAALVAVAAVATAFTLGRALTSALAMSAGEARDEEARASSRGASASVAIDRGAARQRTSATRHCEERGDEAVAMIDIATGASRLRDDGRPWASMLLLLLPLLVVIAIAVVGRPDGSISTIGGNAFEVRFDLAPDLPAGYRTRRGERVAATLVRSLPRRPRGWSWSLPRPSRIDGERDGGVLRLAFAGRREARTASAAMRRALAVRSDVRARVEVAPQGWLAGLDAAATPSLWASATTLEARAALLARAEAMLKRTLPSIELAPMPPARSEWRLTARPRQSAARWGDDLAGGLGAVDSGAVRMAGVEPAIRVEPPDDGADRLGLLAVRSGRGGTSSGVVPLAVAASIERVPLPAARVRHDGALAEESSLVGAGAAELARQARRLAALGGATSRVSLGGGAAALARRSAELRVAWAIGALLVLLVLVGTGGSLRGAAVRFAPVPVAWSAAWAGASLATSGGAAAAGGGPTVTLALLAVTPLAALAAGFSPAIDEAETVRREAVRELGSRGWGGMVASTVAGALAVTALGADDPIGRALAIAVGLGLLAALLAARLVMPRRLGDRARRPPAGSAATESAAPIVGPAEPA
jgi:hypothetical protein